MSREFRVSSTALHVATHAEKPRGGVPRVESGSWLEVTREFDEPVRDVQAMAAITRSAGRHGLHVLCTSGAVAATRDRLRL
jgi:hypothetical protein